MQTHKHDGGDLSMLIRYAEKEAEGRGRKPSPLQAAVHGAPRAPNPTAETTVNLPCESFAPLPLTVGLPACAGKFGSANGAVSRADGGSSGFFRFCPDRRVRSSGVRHHRLHRAPSTPAPSRKPLRRSGALPRRRDGGPELEGSYATAHEQLHSPKGCAF